MAHEHKKHHSCCQHGQAALSVHQTLDEMEFERGLWSAALNGELDRVQQLLSQSCDVNAPDTASYTALVSTPDHSS